MQGREEVYRIGVECQMKMQELEEKCVEKVSSVVDSLTEEHKQEVRLILYLCIMIVYYTSYIFENFPDHDVAKMLHYILGQELLKSRNMSFFSFSFSPNERKLYSICPLFFG